ncbi:MAG: hypothetical protein Q9163_003467 [Psora crenata]
MKLSLTDLSILLSFSSAASASAGTRVFHNAVGKPPVLGNRHPARIIDSHRHQKRTSPYLNDATQSQHLYAYKLSELANQQAEFIVNGTGIPDVNFDVGESYSGLLPISQAANETRELFFWFFPSSNPAAFNGGPGCSSLSGLLSENGPFTWEAGTLAPAQNPYSWVNLTNMIWVEQPVGVGFTQGVPNITNEVELAQEFLGFYKSFVDAFNVQGRKVYLTGESYGGFYVPYIANAFINANDATYYNLAGVAINDPILGDSTNQQQVVIAPYVDYWSNLFYLNETFITALHQRADQCGYTDYLSRYFTFPPPQETFPVLPDPFATNDTTCDIFDDVFNAAILANPCFNIYHITETCPHPWSVLGIINPGDYSPPGEIVYFNRSDVQAAINAPVGTNWMQCTSTNVFGESTNNQSAFDQSLGPAQDGVLTHVIESINNTFIGVGDLDFILPTNGTLLALQNMTWGGKQGFRKYPAYKDFYVPYHPEYNGGALSAAGNVGNWGYERGLTFYNVHLAGHELPGYAPGAGYRIVEAMLGRIRSLDQNGDFTTQTGNFTGTTPIYKQMRSTTEHTK